MEASVENDARRERSEADGRSGRRPLSGERAQRILAAMRESVGTRGAAGATFDHVAREAGVSRGLLHYYFGSKEQLLVEVVRRDADVRIAQLDEGFRAATSADAVVEVLLGLLKEFVGDAPGSQAVLYEILSASRRSEDIRAELAELYRRWREHLADLLRGKQEQGVVELRAEPEAVAEILIALGDGLGMQLVSDPRREASAALKTGVATARWLLGAD